MNANKADKLWIKFEKDQQKRIKPGECRKYVRLVFDDRLMQNVLGVELNKNFGIKYDICRLALPNIILWERNIGQRTFEANNGDTDLNEGWQLEPQVVLILNEMEFRHAVKGNTLKDIGLKLRTHYPGKSCTIIVPGLKDKNRVQQQAFVDAQVLQQLNIFQLPVQNTYELMAVLCRYTKAIAEAPYKTQRAETLGRFKKYLANDKKNCVRIESGNGYGRLWQQHLNRLPQVTLAVAETIIWEFSCPSKLIHNFNNNTDAVATLANLKIKRCGPEAMQTDRRIGSVLAGKLYTLYNTRDPNTQL